MLESGSNRRVFSYRSLFTYNVIRNSGSNSSDGTSAYSYHEIPLYDAYNPYPSDDKSEETFATKAFRKIIIFILYIVVIALFPITTWFCIKKIHALERLVIFRLGKLQPVTGPGFCLILPVIDVYQRVDLNSKKFLLPNQQLITADRAIVDVSAEIEYCVSHVIHFVTRLPSQESSIKELSLHCFSNIVSGKEQSDVEEKKDEIASYVKINLNKTVVNWGVEVLAVIIPQVKIIKECTRENPLDSVLNVLKAVGGSNNSCKTNSSAEKKNLFDHEDFSIVNHFRTESRKKHNLNNDDILIKLKDLVHQVSDTKPITNKPVLYKFQVLNEPNSVRNIYLSIFEGISTVYESGSETTLPDLEITLSLKVMEDLLNFELSPAQAYAKGDLEIKGDFSLLNLFKDIWKH